MHCIRAALSGPSRTPRVTKSLRIPKILAALLGWTILYHSQMNTLFHINPYAAKKAYMAPLAHYHLAARKIAVVEEKRITRAQVMTTLGKMFKGESLDRGNVAYILNESKKLLQALDTVYSVPIQTDKEGDSPYSSKKVTVSRRAAAMYCIPSSSFNESIHSSKPFFSQYIDSRRRPWAI